MAAATLADIVTPPPLTRVNDVVGRLQSVEAALPPGDGVRCFTRLYLRVTEAVRDALDQGAFRDGRVAEQLDVNFAGYFFRALRDTVAAPEQVPRCWQALVEVRTDRAIAPLQFALAGMNAHINHDLPLAVVQTWGEFGLVPTDGTGPHADYEAINTILARVQEEVKAEFDTGLVGVWDHAMAPVDDRVAHWSVCAARGTAWRNAQVLWALRGDPELTDLFMSGLDRLCSLAGRGLLLHPDSVSATPDLASAGGPLLA